MFTFALNTSQVEVYLFWLKPEGQLDFQDQHVKWQSAGENKLIAD